MDEEELDAQDAPLPFRVLFNSGAAAGAPTHCGPEVRPPNPLARYLDGLHDPSPRAAAACASAQTSPPSPSSPAVPIERECAAAAEPPPQQRPPFVFGGEQRVAAMVAASLGRQSPHFARHPPSPLPFPPQPAAMGPPAPAAQLLSPPLSYRLPRASGSPHPQRASPPCSPPGSPLLSLSPLLRAGAVSPWNRCPSPLKRKTPVRALRASGGECGDGGAAAAAAGAAAAADDQNDQDPHGRAPSRSGVSPLSARLRSSLSMCDQPLPPAASALGPNVQQLLQRKKLRPQGEHHS